MLKLHFHKKSFLLPENYNELTGEQLISVNKILLTGEPMEMIRLKLLRVLLQMNLYQFFRLSADCKHRILFEDETEVSRIDWLFDKNTLTEQLLPKYERFYGPKKEFDNLRVKEFHVCEIAYYDYLQTGEDEHLDKLIAVLYRPAKDNYNFKKDPDGDCRIDFNPNELAYYMLFVSSWPVEVKAAILCFYDGNREFLRQLYDEVFVSGESSGEEEQTGMYDVIRNLSGSRYGTFKQVEEMFVHDIMREIISSMADEKRQEELLNKTT